MSDIKGLEIWEDEAKAYGKRAGDLRMRAGASMIDALEGWYAHWKLSPTKRNTREYQLWRLRLHLRWNAEPEFLEELDDLFDLGLYDTRPGKTFWDVEAEASSAFTTGFNWRKDSGNALKGAAAKRRNTED